MADNSNRFLLSIGTAVDSRGFEQEVRKIIQDVQKTSKFTAKIDVDLPSIAKFKQEYKTAFDDIINKQREISTISEPQGKLAAESGVKAMIASYNELYQTNLKLSEVKKVISDAEKEATRIAKEEARTQTEEIKQSNVERTKAAKEVTRIAKEESDKRIAITRKEASEKARILGMSAEGYPDEYEGSTIGSLQEVSTNVNAITGVPVSLTKSFREADGVIRTFFLKYDEDVDDFILSNEKTKQSIKELAKTTQTRLDLMKRASSLFSDISKNLNQSTSSGTILDTGFGVLGSPTSRMGLKEILAQINELDPASVEANLALTDLKMSLTTLETEAAKMKSIEGVRTKIETLGRSIRNSLDSSIDPSYKEKLTQILEKVERLKDSINENPVTGELVNENSVRNAVSELKNLNEQFDKTQSKQKAAIEASKLYENALKKQTSAEVELYKAQKDFENNPYTDPARQQEYISSLTTKYEASKKYVNIAKEEQKGVIALSEAERLESAALNDLNAEKAKLDITNKKQIPFLKNIANGFKDATARVINYTLAYRALWLVMSKLKESITIAKELNKTLVDLQIVTGGTKEATEALLSTYNKMAQVLGSTTKEVATAANEFLRMGMNVEDTNKMITASMYLSKLGMISSAESTQYLTSATKGYKLEAEQAMDIVDKLTAVDMSAAVSAGYLAEAMSRTASSARLSGLEMNQLLGIIAATGETSQASAERIGEAWKTATARFRNVKVGKAEAEIMGADEESLENINDIERALATQGIKIRKNASEWRDYWEVINDVSAKYEELKMAGDDRGINTMMTALFGTRQAEIGITAFENFDKVLQYTEISLLSAGTAAEKYRAYEEGIEFQTQRLTAEFESMVIALKEGDMIRGFTKLTADLLHLFNSIGGVNAIIGILIGYLIMFKSAAIMGAAITAISKMVVVLKHAVLAFQLVTSGAVTATSALKLLGITATATQLAMFGIIAVFAAVAIAANNYVSELDKVNDSIDEYNSKISGMEVEKERLEAIKDRTKSEQEYLDLVNAELKATENLLLLDRQRQFELTMLTAKYAEANSLMMQGMKVDTSGTTGLGDIQKTIDEYKRLSTVIPKTVAETRAHNKQLAELRVQITGSANKLKVFSDANIDITEEGRTLYSALLDLINGFDETGISAENAGDSILSFSTDLEKANKEIDSIQSNLNDLANAHEELSKGEQLSASALLDLIQKYPQYAAVIADANKNRQATIDLTELLFDLEKEQAKMTLTAQAAILENEIKIGRAKLANVRGSIYPSMAKEGLVPEWLTTLSKELKEAERQLDMIGGAIKTIDSSSIKDFNKVPSKPSSPSKVEKEEEVVDHIAEQSKLFKEQIRILEHKLFLMQQNGAAIEDQIVLQKEVQQALNEQANWYRSEGLAEEDAYITELQKMWWQYKDTILEGQHQILNDQKNMYEARLALSTHWIEERNFHSDWGADNEIAAWNRVLVWLKNDFYDKGLMDYETYNKEKEKILHNLINAEKAAWEKAHQEELDNLNKQLKAQSDLQKNYESAHKAILKVIQKETDAINKQIDAAKKQSEDLQAAQRYALSVIDKQIEALEKEKQALQDKNDEEDRALELKKLQESLENAKRQKTIRVFHEDKGWVNLCPVVQ